MNYNQWISFPITEMINVELAELKDIVAGLPADQKELDATVREKLGTIVLVWVSGAVMARDITLLSEVYTICSKIVSVFPQEAPELPYCMGVFSVLTTVWKTVELKASMDAATQ